MLADILPTAYEVGVLNGGVSPGDVVAIVGAGPIGLSAITGALLFSPSHIIAIDLADSRLEAAKQFGADVTVNNSSEDPVAIIRDLTDGLGADVAIEAVGTPATFELATELDPARRPRRQHRRPWQAGHAAPRNPLDSRRDDHDRPRRHLLHADTRRLMATGQLKAARFATHHFRFDEFMGLRRVLRRGRDRRPQGRTHPCILSGSLYR